MAKKTLNIVESAYRAVMEEQDDTILWLLAAMQSAGAEHTVVIVCLPVVPPMRDNPAGHTTDQGRGTKREQVSGSRANHDASPDHHSLASHLLSLWQLRRIDDQKMLLGRRHSGRQRCQRQKPSKQKASHPPFPAAGSSML